MGIEGGTAYCKMEFLEGTTLAQELAMRRESKTDVMQNSAT